MINKIQEWSELQVLLKEVKAKEMKLRKEICNDILHGMPLPARKTISIQDIEVKAENTVTHNLDESVLNEMYEELDTKEKAVIKWQPKLKLRDYKKLPDESLLHEAVIVKPSSPTLKLL